MKRVPVHPAAAAIRDREMSPEEFDARLKAALADEERMRELADLVRWFRRRYPTIDERLAYARRKYRDIAKD
jgi:hypothetical protein